MAIKGTPNGGLDDIAELAYVTGPDCTLVCYTNTPDSLGPTTLVADLVQPTQVNGYAPIVLGHANWTALNGILTYVQAAGPNTDEFGNPMFVATGVWSAPVTGVAIIRGARVRHFQDRSLAFTAADGKKFSVDLATVVS